MMAVLVDPARLCNCVLLGRELLYIGACPVCLYVCVEALGQRASRGVGIKGQTCTDWGLECVMGCQYDSVLLVLFLVGMIFSALVQLIHRSRATSTRFSRRIPSVGTTFLAGAIDRHGYVKAACTRCTTAYAGARHYNAPQILNKE